MSIPMWQLAAGSVGLFILLWGVIMLALKPGASHADPVEEGDPKASGLGDEQSQPSTERHHKRIRR